MAVNEEYLIDAQAPVDEGFVEAGPASTSAPAAFSCSADIADLATALALAQSEIMPAVKDSTNPHFRSSYADLAAVWEVIRGPLTRHGLSVVQLPRVRASASGATCVEVQTVLLHKSGQWMSDRLLIPVSKVDAQGIGSAITYGRRYSLQAITGVAPDDDDGEGAVGRGNRYPAAHFAPARRQESAAQQHAPASRRNPADKSRNGAAASGDSKTIDKAEASELAKAMRAGGVDHDALFQQFGIERLGELPVAKVKAFREAIKKATPPLDLEASTGEVGKQEHEPA